MAASAGADRVVVLDVADFRYAHVNIIGGLSCGSLKAILQLARRDDVCV